jgi:plasmid maintenance system antidote protein VapI
MDKRRLEIPKIGDILKEEFLEPIGVTAYRLSKYFGTTSKFWLNLQNELDLRKTTEKMASELEKIHVYKHTA